jgi:hypothetical protein
VEQGTHRQQLTRVQRLRPRPGYRQFHLVQKVNPRKPRREQDRRLRERKQRHEHRQQAYRLHRSNEANGQQKRPADNLSLERQPDPRAHLSGHRFNRSDHPRHHLGKASRKQAGLPQPPNPDRLVARRTLLSERAVKVSDLSNARQPHRPVPVRPRVTAELSEDSRATANLARHLAVQGLTRRAEQKSVDNLAPINLQPRHLPVQVRVKREVDHRQGRVPTVNLSGSREAGRKLHLSAGRDNRRVGRKKGRGLQRRGHNYLVNFRGGFEAKKFRSRFFA